MKINVFISVLLALLYTGCKQQKDIHDHETEAAANHDTHNHEAEAESTHEHGDVNLQLTAYS